MRRVSGSSSEEEGRSTRDDDSGMAVYPAASDKLGAHEVTAWQQSGRAGTLQVSS